MFRIGVDVGGTNTDSAILDLTLASTPSRGVLASCKTPTTVDITSGITKVIEDVLAKSKVAKLDVLSVAIGTTHFVNAVVEADARRLSKVAVVRLCGPTTRNVPPFADFPAALKKIMAGPTYYLEGGLEIDGREITPLNHAQIKETVEKITEAGVSSIALVGVFSPLDHAGIHEEFCKALMLKINPSLEVVCSHAIGGVGLLERENATILNASILAVAKKTINGFRKAMTRLSLTCPLYLTQNDGTLTDADVAAKFPIKTFASGPTNSMTGAAFLAGLDKHRSVSDSETASQVLVLDIGGTTTDVCALLPSGFPRQAPNFVEVGGVRTAFSMPEVLSVGLGGGSRIGWDKKGTVTVGPDSVGHYLTTKALVFGGEVTTSTDIVVAAGKQKIGQVDRVSHIPEHVVTTARKEIKRLLQRAVEEMKISAAPVTVLLVGGGSIVYMDELDGVAECIIPPHHDSANAVGAAIAKVAGEVDIIEILAGRDEAEILKTVRDTAIAAAISKGAEPADVQVVEIEKIPLQYVSNKATRIKAKAVGKLLTPSVGGTPKSGASATTQVEDVMQDEDEAKEEDKAEAVVDAHKNSTKPALEVDILSYRPRVRSGIWYVSEVDLEFISCGAGVLGTGGGGPTYLAFLVALEALRQGGPDSLQVISAESLNNDKLVAFGSWYGAPSVSGERIPSGTEIPTAIDALNKMLGVKDDDWQALATDEIGGGNGLCTFPTSIHYKKPTVDGDMMGRAYPTMEHGTHYVYGHPITPCAMADASGNVSVVMSSESNTRLEKMLRATCIELGLNVSIVAKPMPGQVIKQYGVPNSISQAWYLGRAIHLARRTKTSFLKAIFDVQPGKPLFVGKVIDVQRDIGKGGYTVGRLVLAPLSEEEKESTDSALPPAPNGEHQHLVIPFQNEYLSATYCDASGENESAVLCVVPDLISILGQDGEAIGSQDMRYGLKVIVICMPAHPLWTADERGLKIGGPEYFGLGIQWKSIGEWEKPRSVIKDFA